MEVLFIFSIILAAASVFAIVLIIVSRRSHLRSWRLGVFYESEERFNGGDDQYEN